MPNKSSSCSIKDTGHNSSVQCMHSEAARPVCMVGVWFFSGLACIILDKKNYYLAQIPDILAAVTISRLNNVITLL